MKFNSIIQERGSVTFPEFLGERVYMREFFKKEGLPIDLSRWQPTVDQMLDGVGTDGPIYLMIDQAQVFPGTTHRREGIHIDGYWNPGVAGHGTHRHLYGHTGNKHLPAPSHRGSRHCSDDSTWRQATFKEPEGLILASNISACVGYRGEFEGPIGEGGDCSHVDLETLNPFLMDEGKVYAGNVTCLHESIPVNTECYRTLVRLNTPGWSP